MTGDDRLSDGDRLAVWLAVHAPELREPYALAHRLLDAPEVAALRAKAAAADRVRELAEEVALAHEEAKANARANRDPFIRSQYIGRAWGLGDVLTDLRAALHGGDAPGSGDGHRT